MTVRFALRLAGNQKPANAKALTGIKKLADFFPLPDSAPSAFTDDSHTALNRMPKARILQATRPFGTLSFLPSSPAPDASGGILIKNATSIIHTACIIAPINGYVNKKLISGLLLPDFELDGIDFRDFVCLKADLVL